MLGDDRIWDALSTETFILRLVASRATCGAASSKKAACSTTRRSNPCTQHTPTSAGIAQASASLAARRARARSAGVPQNWRMNERLPMTSCHVKNGVERTCRVDGTSSHHHPRLGRVQPCTLLLDLRTSSHLSRRLSRRGGRPDFMSRASRSAACGSRRSEIVMRHDRHALGLVGFDPDRAERRVQ